MFKPLVLGYRTYPPRGESGLLQFPVVLVRGLGRSSGFWLEFIDALTPWAKVVAVDLRGTGLSPSKTGLGSIEALAADLVLTLRKEKLLPCHLVGISLGGMVCAQAAAMLAADEGASGSGSNISQNNVVSLSMLASSARFTGERRLVTPSLRTGWFPIKRSRPGRIFRMSGIVFGKKRDFSEWPC
jgi:pimeloyl-ACP methyl ester carboxylesterase